MSLASKIASIQGQQRQRLIGHRQRMDKAKQDAERDPGLPVEDDLGPVAQIGADLSSPISAPALFRELLGPLTKAMGCEASESAWIEENWGRGPDLLPTLVDWSRKVILESIEVGEGVRACCDQVYRRGASALCMDEPGAEVEVAQKGAEAGAGNEPGSVEPQSAPTRRMRP